MPNYKAIARAAAAKWGVPEGPFMRQLQQESGFIPGRTSSAGARWIGQFIPSTAKAYGVHDDVSSIWGAAHYMHDNLRRYGTMERALSAYNSGRPDAYKDPNFAHGQTFNYVKSIMGGQDVSTAPAHTTGRPSVAQQAAPAENSHMYSDFAMGLVHAMQQHSPEAMLGVIMQLRHAQVKPEPVSSPAFGAPVPKQMVRGQPDMPGGNPLAEMLYAQKLAKQMGLRTSENYDLPGGVAPVHVKGSYHYQRYKGGKVGRATDVSGSPAQMAAYYRALARTHPTELFYDPLGGIKYGKQIGAIGGHSDHVHIAY